MHRLTLLLSTILLLPAPALAGGRQLCLFRTPDGKTHQVNSPDEVPEDYRAGAKCFGGKHEPSPPVGVLSKPDEIELEGTVRQVRMSSAVGRIALRWPRRVEQLFGRTPERAMAEAATTVSRTLKQAGFPGELRSLDIDWNVVFMDENLPEAQIPGYLLRDCHPGWMTPPGNIYIVAQRVARGCGESTSPDRRVSDGRLTQVLLHEMGHAVEFQLLGQRFEGDRMRTEGFASWFEQYAANNSSMIAKGQVQKQYQELARRSLAASPDVFMFSGSAEDYARASLFFSAVASRRGVSGIMGVYETMRDDQLEFVPAVMKRMGWSDRKLGEEIARAVRPAPAP